MGERINGKKLALFSVISAFAPVLSQWATSVQSGEPIAFTAGNILAPAAANLIITLSALFTNPRRKE